MKAPSYDTIYLIVIEEFYTSLKRFRIFKGPFHYDSVSSLGAYAEFLGYTFTLDYVEDNLVVNIQLENDDTIQFALDVDSSTAWIVSDNHTQYIDTVLTKLEPLIEKNTLHT